MKSPASIEEGPNLFIAGFQKCASSTLFDHLKGHPQINGSIPKETYFFTDPDYDNYTSEFNINTTPERIAELYPVSSDEIKYRLEATVANFYQAAALEYAKVNPDLKVIFIIRDPVERFVSVFNYAGTNGLHLPPGTSISDYYQMIIENGLEEKKHLLRFGLEHGHYQKYIDSWKEILGGEKIYVASVKRMNNNLANELNCIFDFLGIKKFDSQNIIYKNKTTVVRYPGLHKKLVNLLGGSFLSTKWTKGVYRNFFYSKKVDSVDEKLKMKLIAEYANEYKELSDYF